MRSSCPHRNAGLIECLLGHVTIRTPAGYKHDQRTLRENGRDGHCTGTPRAAFLFRAIAKEKEFQITGFTRSKNSPSSSFLILYNSDVDAHPLLVDDG